MSLFFDILLPLLIGGVIGHFAFAGGYRLGRASIESSSADLLEIAGDTMLKRELARIAEANQLLDDSARLAEAFGMALAFLDDESDRYDEFIAAGQATLLNHTQLRDVLARRLRDQQQKLLEVDAKYKPPREPRQNPGGRSTLTAEEDG